MVLSFNTMIFRGGLTKILHQGGFSRACLPTDPVSLLVTFKPTPKTVLLPFLSVLIIFTQNPLECGFVCTRDAALTVFHTVDNIVLSIAILDSGASLMLVAMCLVEVSVSL